jgi:hypothetical protein
MRILTVKGVHERIAGYCRTCAAQSWKEISTDVYKLLLGPQQTCGARVMFSIFCIPPSKVFDHLVRAEVHGVRRP